MVAANVTVEIEGRTYGLEREHLSPRSCSVTLRKDRKTTYRVSRFHGIWDCACPGFTYRKTCKHVTEMKRRWGEDEHPQPNTTPAAPLPHRVEAPARPAIQEQPMAEQKTEQTQPIPNTDEIRRVEKELAAPFAQGELKFRPGAVAKDGKRALALPYVDARLVQERLDAAVGVLGWKTCYRELEGGCVVCTLSLRVAGEWISKEDVGSPSEQPDAGDRTKSAFSDALKRAAVAFGVARYLYHLAPIWADYDPQRKRFVSDPQVPTNGVARARPPATRPQQRDAPRAAETSEEKLTEEQWQEIEDLLEKLRYDRTQFERDVHERFSHLSPRQMTQNQAAQVIVGMQKRLKANGKAAPARAAG